MFWGGWIVYINRVLYQIIMRSVSMWSFDHVNAYTWSSQKPKKNDETTEFMAGMGNSIPIVRFCVFQWYRFVNPISFVLCGLCLEILSFFVYFYLYFNIPLIVFFFLSINEENVFVLFGVKIIYEMALSKYAFRCLRIEALP